MKTKKKDKQPPLYLPNGEIEKLNKRYELLVKQVKTAPDLSPAQMERECEILLAKYNFEIEEKSKYYEADYWQQQAEIEAKNAEQIPWRRSWLWLLLGQPVTNRAQDLIEERAELEAEKLFIEEEQKLEKLKGEIYGEKGKELSERKRKKLLKKYLKYKRLLKINDTAAAQRLEAALDKASENVRPFDEPAELGTPQDEQKPAENVAELKPGETDKPAEAKPEKAKKTKRAKKETPGKLPGQVTFDDVQPVQSGEPIAPTSTTLTA